MPRTFLIGWGILMEGMMKSLVLIVILAICHNTFAQTMSAVEALSSVIKVGEYKGKNENGRCVVLVSEVNYPQKALAVKVSDKLNSVTKLVEEGSEFKLGMRKEFIQTTTSSIDENEDSYVERIVRTVLAGENQLYVVTSYATVMNREINRTAVDCVINL